MTVADARAEFHRLHESGCFVMPNVPDAGSARLLAGESARRRSPPRARGSRPRSAGGT